MRSLGEFFITGDSFPEANFQTCQAKQIEESKNKVVWEFGAKVIPVVGQRKRESIEYSDKDWQLRQDVLMKAIAIEDQGARESFLRTQCQGLSFEDKLRLGRVYFGMLNSVYDSSKLLPDSNALGKNNVTINSQFNALKEYYLKSNFNVDGVVCRHASYGTSELLQICGIDKKQISLEVYSTLGDTQEIININDFIPKDYQPQNYKEKGFENEKEYIEDYYKKHDLKDEKDFVASYTKVYEEYVEEVKKKSPDGLSSEHQALTVWDPSGNSKYSVNWSELEKMQGSFAGLPLYLNSKGIRNNGLFNRVYNSQGTFKGYTPTDLGVSLGRALDIETYKGMASPYHYLEVFAKADRSFTDHEIKLVTTQGQNNQFQALAYLVKDDSHSDQDVNIKANAGIVLYRNHEEDPDYGALEQKGIMGNLDAHLVGDARLLKGKNQLDLNYGAGIEVWTGYQDSQNEYEKDGSLIFFGLVKPIVGLEYLNKEKGLFSRGALVVNSQFFRDVHPLTDKKRINLGTQNKTLSLELGKVLKDERVLSFLYRNLQNVDLNNEQYLIKYKNKNTQIESGVSSFKITGRQKYYLLVAQVGQDFKILRIPSSLNLQINKDINNQQDYIGADLRMKLYKTKKPLE